MNHLTHLLLSERHPGVVVGNFIADHIKGSQWKELPREVGIGIQLHRFIDHHADHHEINAALRTTLRPYFGKYAGVALDIYMDHFLTRKWDAYAPLELHAFLEECDIYFERLADEIPERTYNKWQVMYGHGWLLRYGEEAGLDQVFRGMGSRISYETGFDRAIEALTNHRQELETGFNNYFPLLRLASRNRLRKLAGI